MKSWISDCLLQHHKCSAATTSVLPDRVLDVEKGQIPRLHIVKPGDSGTYAALSHCWGGIAALRLTNDNLHDLKNGIAWESLPKTFQDAIDVCRLLDIRYLWIDSLCIIQTSKLDWDEQGSKMHTVYSQALLVIAADGAANSEEGFLRHPKRNHPSLKLPFCPGKRLDSSGLGVDGSQSIHARMKGVGGRDMFFHHSRHGEYRSSLSLRGWVLQESILARRTLHFTAEEVTWECGETSRCECQIAPHAPKNQMIPVKQRLQSRPSHALDWPELVQDFSCRNLTYHTDRLAAMAGLAASLQPCDPAIVYHAGLWSDSLPRSLHWFCVPHGPDLPVSPRISQRITPPCAPTWSWASITGRVVCTTREEATHPYQDMQVSCRLSGKNKYGAVSGAVLTARVHVLEGKVFHDPASTGETQFQVQFWSRVDSKQLLPPVGGTFLDVVGGGSTEIEGGDDVILVVHLLRTFLMLKPESSLDDRTYRRVGLLVCGDFPQDCCSPVQRLITIA